VTGTGAEGWWRRGLHAIPLGLGAALYVFYAHRLFAFTPDDTFIFLRVARNWASGLGPVYNPGEHVQGYTSTLWLLWLTVLEATASRPVLAAKLSSAALGLGLVVTSHLLAREARPQAAAPLAALFLAGFLDIPYWGVSGMETLLFATAANGALYFYLRSWRAPRAIGAAAGLLAVAGLARPEGALVALAIVAFEWHRTGGRPSRLFVGSLAAAAVLIAGQFAWAFAEYGSPLPNTYFAKHLSPVAALVAGVRYLRDFAEFSDGAFVVVLAGLAVVYSRRHDAVRMLGVVGVLFVAYVLWVGGDSWAWLGTQRFLIVALPSLAVMIDVGAGALARLVRPSLATRKARAFAWAAAVVAMGAFLNPTGIGARAVETVAGDHELAQYLRSVAHPGETLIAPDIGQFGYYTPLRIVDTYGLVTPFIARELRKDGVNRYTPGSTARLVEYVFGLDARFVILKGVLRDGAPDVADECGARAIYGDDRFAERYRLLRTARERPYLLFVRRGMDPHGD